MLIGVPLIRRGGSGGPELFVAEDAIETFVFVRLGSGGGCSSAVPSVPYAGATRCMDPEAALDSRFGLIASGGGGRPVPLVLAFVGESTSGSGSVSGRGDKARRPAVSVPVLLALAMLELVRCAFRADGLAGLCGGCPLERTRSDLSPDTTDVVDAWDAVRDSIGRARSAGASLVSRIEGAFDVSRERGAGGGGDARAWIVLARLTLRD